VAQIVVEVIVSLPAPPTTLPVDIVMVSLPCSPKMVVPSASPMAFWSSVSSPAVPW
jgi:hypothetical protein